MPNPHTDMFLTIYLVPSAKLRLEFIAKQTGRKVEDLAASAVEDSAMEFFRNRNDDPVKELNRG